MDGLSIFLGVVLGVAAMRAFSWLRGAAPTIAPVPDIANLVRDLEQEDPALATALASEPAVDPESIPEVLTLDQLSQPAVQEMLKNMPAPAHAMRDVYTAMAKWRPRSGDGRESGYERSLVYLLKRAGFGMRMALKKRVVIPGTATERNRWIQPDVVIDSNLLLELKADLVQASASDRSLGQILRYLVHWKTRGPALLVICGACDRFTQDMMRRYVRIWRTELKLPVGIVFARYDGPAPDLAENEFDAALEAQLTAAPPAGT